MKIQQIKKYTVIAEIGETFSEEMVRDSFRNIGEVLMSFRDVSTDSNDISNIYIAETAVHTEVEGD